MSGDDNQELAQGTLLTPDNAIDTTTGTIRLKATFANQEHSCGRANSSARDCCCAPSARLSRVPAHAVQHGQDSLYVYVVKPNSTVQRQPVVAEDRGT